MESLQVLRTVLRPTSPPMYTRKLPPGRSTPTLANLVSQRSQKLRLLGPFGRESAYLIRYAHHTH